MECGKYDYRVQPGDVDLTQKASIITLGNHILHAAGEDADRLGFGLRWMQSNNTTWVLSRMAIEMDRYPDEYEHYQIETWVSDINRLMTTRNFILHDRAGNAIGKGCTHWSMIDFKRQKTDIPATVKTLEYDPNRSAFIALVEYTDGVKSYIIAPDGLKVGDVVVSSKSADIKPGNCLPFENIPVGTIIHNIELYPGRGAQLVRSAGNMAQLMAKENGYALVRLPSGEMRNVPVNCTAVIGQVSNIDHENVNLGKAGRKRHMGVRPGSRGTVMNPCDHPHGGGEGRAPVGHSGPMTPWGKPALGLKTRKHHKRSDKLIVKRAGK